MNDEEWVSAAKVVELWVGDARSLMAHASVGKVRTRAFEFYRDRGLVEIEESRRDIEAALTPFFWERVLDRETGEADWKTGTFTGQFTDTTNVFDGGGPIHQIALAVEFYWPDVAALLGGVDVPDSCVSIDPLRGILPKHAKNNDRKHEDAAHAAAKIVREEGVTIAAALWRCIELVPKKVAVDASVVRAIRTAFDLMYGRDGKPIKIDLD